ncbi:NfeD family protein [Vibrio mediterranei]|uniref:NfeD family protein n=1 Tax=Vibrio mediterranei TaxID=689 RepID=UPI004067EA13
MLEFLDLTIGWTWLKVAVFFLFFDVLFATGIFIALAIGATIVALITLAFPLHFSIQVLILAVASCGIGYSLWRHKKENDTTPLAEEYGSFLIGRKAKVKRMDEQYHYVVINETPWKAVTEDTLQVGQEVVIRAVEGTVLTIEASDTIKA